MHPYLFWLLPAWPWLIAAESVRLTSAAFAASRASAEIIPFPEQRIRRRVAHAG